VPKVFLVIAEPATPAKGPEMMKIIENQMK